MYFKALAVTLACTTSLAVMPALAQTKVTNQGVTSTEIVLGTHQDCRSDQGMGVPVLNGMQLAVDEINAKGGIHAASSASSPRTASTNRRRPCCQARR